MHIGSLKAIAERAAPLKAICWRRILAGRVSVWRAARPIQIRLEVIEGTNTDVRCRDHRRSSTQSELSVIQFSERCIPASKFAADAGIGWQLPMYLPEMGCGIHPINP